LLLFFFASACALPLFALGAALSDGAPTVDIGDEAGGGPDKDECVPWKKAIEKLRAEGEHRAAAELERKPPACTEKGGVSGVVQGVCQLDTTCKATTASGTDGKQKGVDDSAKEANKKYWEDFMKDYQKMHDDIRDSLRQAIRESPTGEMWGLNDSILDQIYGGDSFSDSFSDAFGSNFNFDTPSSLSGLQDIADYGGFQGGGITDGAPVGPLQVEAPTIPVGSSIFDTRGVTNPDITDSVVGQQHASLDGAFATDDSGWKQFADDLESQPAFRDAAPDPFAAAPENTLPSWYENARQFAEGYTYGLYDPQELPREVLETGEGRQLSLVENRFGVFNTKQFSHEQLWGMRGDVIPQNFSNYHEVEKLAYGGFNNPNEFTAASKEFPNQSRIVMWNPDTGDAVAVRVNDTGPFVPGRDLDVTPKALRAAGVDVGPQGKNGLGTMMTSYMGQSGPTGYLGKFNNVSEAVASYQRQTAFSGSIGNHPVYAAAPPSSFSPFSFGVTAQSFASNFDPITTGSTKRFSSPLNPFR
jgi:hypothetical protein